MPDALRRALGRGKTGMFWFWRLAAAHFVADFPLQTDLVYRFKTSKRWGVGLHVAIHGALTLVVSWPFLGSIWTWVCIAFLLTTHYAMDTGKLRLTASTVPDNMLFFLLDQVLHLVWIVVACVANPDAGAAPFGIAAVEPFWMDDRVFQFVIALIIAMSGGEVLLYYAQKAIMAKTTQQIVVFPSRLRRIMRISERGAITVGVAFGGLWLIPLGLAVAVRFHSIIVMRRHPYKIGLVMGLSLAVGVGLVLRFAVVGVS